MAQKIRTSGLLKISSILKKKGYFLDLAATNGLMENNTFVLEYFFNWNGLAIVANEIFFKKLKKNRKCIGLNEVVSKNEESSDVQKSEPRLDIK